MSMIMIMIVLMITDGDGYDDVHQQRADPDSSAALWKSPTDFCGFNFKLSELQNTDLVVKNLPR